MNPARKAAIVVLILLGAASAAQAEVVEEIIAWVNGDIITLSEYEDEEQTVVAELYRRYSGEELDTELKRARGELLQRMIDNKILIHHAHALGLDMDKMGESFLQNFKEQQKIASDLEFERLLAQEGMTVAQLQSKLLDLYAPEQVINYEVGQRVAVGEREVEEYYAAHPDQFVRKGHLTLREIVILVDEKSAKSKDDRRALAVDLRQRIALGENFEELARESSEAGTKETGGLLGPLQAEELSEVLRVPATTLPVGEVSEVMETPYGFHIVRVESRVEESTKPLAEIREPLREALTERKYMTDLKKFLDKCRLESEWCVKAKHQQLLTIPAPTSCEKI